MRILVLSDPIWAQPPSGYSKIADHLCLLFTKDGHSVAHVPMDLGIRSTSMLKGHTMLRRGTLLLESGAPGDILSEAVSLKHYYDFKADFLLTIKDIHNFRWLTQFPLNWVPFIPVDHKPVSNAITLRCKTIFHGITITRFGKREMQKAKIPTTYIPLFVNADNYMPIEEMSEERHKQLGATTRGDCKRAFGILPDNFTILIMKMNRLRGMLPRAIRACKRFLENNTDAQKDTRIMLWTSQTPDPVTMVESRGTVLGAIIKKLELDPYVIGPGPDLYSKGLEEWKMPLLYNAADCGVNAAQEGFFLPGIEGGACGLRWVVLDYAAAPEVTTGELAKWSDYENFSPIGYDNPLVDIDDMAKGIEKVYNGDPERFIKEARQYALKYDMLTVYQKYWRPFLEKIEPELRPLITKDGIKSWKLQ